MIKLVNLTKTFTSKTGIVKILDNIDLELPSTGFVSLCGKSGCGKTTLLKMLDGQINDYQGEILYDGINIKELSLLKRNKFYSENVFYLKYNSNFFLKLKVEQAIDFYLNKIEKERMNALIERYELKDLLKKKIKQLSSGELQKISLSLAISKQAKITLLDEPICNIDNKSMNGFIDQIIELAKNSLVIYVSHFEKDIENKYDIKLRMYDGKITVEKDADLTKYNTQVEKNDISNHFNLKRAFLTEYVKPNSFYIFFRCVFIMIILVYIFVFNVNKTNYSNIYMKEIDKMSVNIFSSSSSIENDAVKKSKMYVALNEQTLSYFPIGLYSSLSISKGFGRASDYRFNGFNQKLNKGEVIISDYYANIGKIQLGDELAFMQNSTIEPKVAYPTNKIKYYTVKFIYETDYAYIQQENGTSYIFDKIPDFYTYFFMSDEDIEELEELSINGYIGTYLDSKNYIVSWKDEYATNTNIAINLKGDAGKQEDYKLEPLADDEFYGDVISNSNLGLDYFTKDWSATQLSGSQEPIDVTFTYKGKSVTKKLKYKKRTKLYNRTFLSENTFNEIAQALGITKDNSLDYLSYDVDTIDFNNSNYLSIFNNVDNLNYIDFTNTQIIRQASINLKTMKSFVNENASVAYILGSLFLAMFLYEIIKIEKNTFIMLKEKNFKISTSVLITLLTKVIIWSLICVGLFIINIYMINLIQL